MVSIPKTIGLMSCGFLLCLGLSNPTQAVAADGTHTREPGGPRVGGQSGQHDVAPAPAVEGEKASAPHTRQPDGPRVGGQSGHPGPKKKKKAGTPHTRQPDGPRVGGQGGGQ